MHHKLGSLSNQAKTRFTSSARSGETFDVTLTSVVDAEHNAGHKLELVGLTAFKAFGLSNVSSKTCSVGISIRTKDIDGGVMEFETLAMSLPTLWRRPLSTHCGISVRTLTL